jgi:hypothetical protein
MPPAPGPLRPRTIFIRQRRALMPMVKRGCVGLLVMLVLACSSNSTISPTPTPTPPLVGYAGTWTGQFQLASSSSVAMCGPAGRALGDVDDLELTLRASDGDLTGNLNVSVMCTSSFAGSTPQTWRKEYVVPVKGTTDGILGGHPNPAINRHRKPRH